MYYFTILAGKTTRSLKQFFEPEIPEELAHAQFLADKIASLGGKPVTRPRAVPATIDPREMLENVLAAERQAIADYKERAEQAQAYGDKGLAAHLETIVEDETSHYEETEKILRGWT